MKKVLAVIAVLFGFLLVAGGWMYTLSSERSRADGYRALLARAEKEAVSAKEEAARVAANIVKTERSRAELSDALRDLRGAVDGLQKESDAARRLADEKDRELTALRRQMVQASAVQTVPVDDGRLVAVEKERDDLMRKASKDRARYSYNLGVLFEQSGKHDEAIRAFEESIAADGDEADAHYNLAIMYDTVKHDAIKALHHVDAYRRLCGASCAGNADLQSMYRRLMLSATEG